MSLLLPKTRTTALYSAAAAFSVAFLTLFVFWFLTIRKVYSPISDEFALLANSARMFHPHPTEWFLRGYHDYFVVYPSVSPRTSNFLRPTINILYYVGSWIFGWHLERYLLTNYFFIASLVAATVYFGKRFFNISRWSLIALFVLAFFSPAVEEFAVYFPNAPLDVIGALCVLLAMMALLQRNLVLAFLCLAIAVSSKETAHFAPIAAALFWIYDSNRPYTARHFGPAALLISPVAVLYGLRFFAFRKDPPGSVYILAGSRSVRAAVIRMLHGAVSWPLHVFTQDSLSGVAGQTQSFLARNLLRLACVLFWITLCMTMSWMIKSYMHKRKVEGVEGDKREKERALLLCVFFLVCSLALPVALQLPSRFGALTYPLLTMIGVYLFSSNLGRIWRNSWAVMLGILFVLSVHERESVFAKRDFYRGLWAVSHSYLDAARSAPPGTLLLEDDVVGGLTRPEYVGAVVGHHGEVIRVNDLAMNGAACVDHSTYRQTSQRTLQFTFPSAASCATAYLTGALLLPKGAWTYHQGNTSIEYHFTTTRSLANAQVKVEGLQPVSILSRDPASGTYRLEILW